MMCKRKWFALLTIFIIYIMLGASFFYKIESVEERLKRNEAERERQEIKDKLYYFLNDSHPVQLQNILQEISVYCNKPILDSDNTPVKWDYYHSVFFAITVVTTIGYGNLAPTTDGSRIFMIVYGLIGIPVNGILFTTLGAYFGNTFIKIYRKWKNNKVKHYAANLNMISKIVLYLIPGLILFLFVPAIVIQHFEHWDYVLSVYYAFVTLTTIGFGDYVAGVTNKGFGELYFIIYQIFLVVWIIFGLGYLVMVIGFLTRGLRSKKMARFEKHLTQNLKSTHTKIWSGLVKDFTYLRRIMNELYMEKFKPVYRDDFQCKTPPKIGSQSFPDLRKLIQVELSPKPSRRRAFSECISRPITRVQSDTDLHRIDKEATFASIGIVQPSELLANVATALTKTTLGDSDDEGGFHGFSDREILESEIYGSGWTLGSLDMPAQAPRNPRCRASSEVKIPNKVIQDNADWTWSGPYATQKIKELRQKTKFDKLRTKGNSQPKTLFDKIKSSWSKNIEEKDIEKQDPTFNNNLTVYSLNNQPTYQTIQPGFTIEQERYLKRTKLGRCSVFSVPEQRVLEETSVADLIRALNSIHSKITSTELPEPRRKFGTSTPPKQRSLIDLFTSPNLVPSSLPPYQTSTATPSSSRGPLRPPMTRRGSLAPPVTRRRFSLHPVSEDQLLVPPPPYSAQNVSVPPPALNVGAQQSANLRHKQVQRLRGPANSRILYTRTRHNSLKDIRDVKLDRM